jgi:hypothetical protein
MFAKTLVLLSLVYGVLLWQVPTPPNPKQFTITAGKSKGSPQIEVTTNYVDRLVDLFRIDVTNLLDATRSKRIMWISGLKQCP